jgi:hypothetical protein
MGVSRQFASHVGSWDKVGRILLVLLILASFAVVQTASVVEIGPDHHGPNDHCCAGGHAGHFPVLVSVSTVHIQTPGTPESSWIPTLRTTAAPSILLEPRPLNLASHFCVRFGHLGVIRPGAV